MEPREHCSFQGSCPAEDQSYAFVDALIAVLLDIQRLISGLFEFVAIFN